MLRDDKIKNNLFSRRAAIALFGKLSFMSILVGRLYYLQIIRSKDYKTQSENNSIKIFYITPKRGIIVDQNNKILAVNKERYRIFANRTASLNLIKDKISDLVDVDYAKIEKIPRLKQQNKMILLYDDLSFEDLVKLEVELFDTDSIKIDVAHSRYYPFNTNTAHILGYIVSDKEKHIYQQDLMIGKSAIEKSFNLLLTGNLGIKKAEINARGQVVREISYQKEVDGQKLTMGLDIDLQNHAMNLMAERSGAAVVIDIDNGNIIASASTPSFDANQFSNGIKDDYWQKISKNLSMPLINRAISSSYPPGSTFKTIVALAALEEKLSAELKFDCIGYVLVGERRFHCWQIQGHGILNLTQAIAQSCNCYFFNIVKKIGIEKIAYTAEKFGLGKKLGIEIEGEVGGLLPNKKWKKQKINRDWQIGDSLNASIGQGYVLSTPLQLAVMTARIASGKNIIPYFIYQKERIFSDLNIDPANLKIIRSAMEKVVNTPYGVAYNSRIADDNMKMAGKTGTSQVISKRNNKDNLSRNDILESNRNHGLFVGYAPIEKPKFACSVIVEHGGSGSKDAAPIAREIMIKAQEEMNKLSK